MKIFQALRRGLARGQTPTAERVTAGLTGRSQVELEQIEEHERAHEARPKVLDKLRYLRGKEPVKGYDSLEPEGVGPALEGAGIETLDAVRQYERKFRRRSEVLDEVARLRQHAVAQRQ